MEKFSDISYKKGWLCKQSSATVGAAVSLNKWMLYRPIQDFQTGQRWLLWKCDLEKNTPSQMSIRGIEYWWKVVNWDKIIHLLFLRMLFLYVMISTNHWYTQKNKHSVSNIFIKANFLFICLYDFHIYLDVFFVSSGDEWVFVLFCFLLYLP